MEILQPVFAVAKQEMHHIVRPIIEAKAVPSRMQSASACMEELRLTSAQIAKPFIGIPYRMAMHQIHNHGNAHLVSLVNKLFELIWCAKTTAWRKEITDMITETTVIRMLLDGHQLQGVVAQSGDAWQDVCPELIVGSDTLSLVAMPMCAS